MPALCSRSGPAAAIAHLSAAKVFAEPPLTSQRAESWRSVGMACGSLVQSGPSSQTGLHCKTVRAISWCILLLVRSAHEHVSSEHPGADASLVFTCSNSESSGRRASPEPTFVCNLLYKKHVQKPQCIQPLDPDPKPLKLHEKMMI